MAVCQRATRHADAAHARPLRPGELGHRGTRAGPDAALDRTLRALGGIAGRGTIGRRRSHVGATDPQVVEDRRRHDRDRSALGREADAAFREPGHHAVGSRQAEGGTAGQADGVDALDERAGTQQVRLTRPRCSASHVDAGDGAIGGEDDRTAGDRRLVRCMADPQATDVAQGEGCSSAQSSSDPRDSSADM